jgi:hypothetical protein
MSPARSAVPSLSWIRPDAKGKPLLYASDEGRGEVDVYDFERPSRRLEGRLFGFNLPLGMCSDASGNVYVTDFVKAEAVEYAKGASKPKRHVKVTGNPIGCSVDATTGNLAVSAFQDANQTTGAGGVWIFAHGSGSPVLYSDPNLTFYWSPGYDDKGNLFVEGENPNAPTLDELARGATSLSEISLSGTSIGSPGGVMWDGKYVAAADQAYDGGTTTAIYRVSISGSTGTVASIVQLSDSCNASGGTAVAQPWISGTTVVGGNLDCTFRFDYWSYPKGGKPIKSIDASIAPEYGSGQTISE